MPTTELTSTALRPDGKHEAIVTLDVRGRFIRWRRAVFAVLIAVWVAAPFVRIGGHPALALDIDARRFHLFGGTFNAQDTWLLVPLALALLFALLFVTAWRGRLWCGWACPQTVLLEGLYRPIERLFEGPRSQRLHRARGNAGGVARTAGKHVTFAALSVLLATVVWRPFVGIHPAWLVAVAALLYANFAFFREQFCVVLCPYGRLQSVLHDDDSVVVGYDARRGEPRGKLRKASLPVVAEPRGDCIDCKKCVWACPTGIDIRNGLQMECLACAQCLDVCDEVMEKIGRPKGLIRYASTAELSGRGKRRMRPRLVLYGAVTLLACGAALASVVGRSPFEANVIRSPGVPWVLEGPRVRNQIDVHLVNKHPTNARFRLAVDPAPGVDVRLGRTEIELASLGHARVPVVLIADRAAVARPLTIVVRDADAGLERRLEVRLLAPP